MRVKGIITVCGVLSSSVWLVLSLITRGVPLWLCRALQQMAPPFLSEEILKMGNGFYYDVPNNNMPQLVFLSLFTLAFLIYLGSVIFLKNSSQRHTGLIIFFAVLFRIFLIPSVPIHENDIYRYIWDGKVFSSGINPYKYPPDDARLLYSNEYADKRHWRELGTLKTLRDSNKKFFYRIGYREVPTIYPPLAEFLFFTGNALRRDSIAAMKSIFVIFDIMAMFVLYRILVHLKLNTDMVIVYAWSPLILKEIANSGHLDSMVVFFMILSLYLMIVGRKTTASVSLSLGVLSKLFPIVLIPLFLKRYRMAIVWITAALLAGYAPFVIWGGVKPPVLFDGLFIFGKKWAVNGGVFEFTRSILKLPLFTDMSGIEISAKLLMFIFYIASLIFILKGRLKDDMDFLRRAFLSIALFFLLSPVANPWYFSWVVPFLCIFPSISFIILSWLLVFSYLYFTRDYPYLVFYGMEFDRIVLIQYLPFYILLAAELLCTRVRRLAY